MFVAIRCVILANQWLPGIQWKIRGLQLTCISILTHVLTVGQVNLTITTRMNNSFLETLLRLATIETGRQETISQRTGQALSSLELEHARGIHCCPVMAIVGQIV